MKLNKKTIFFIALGLLLIAIIIGTTIFLISNNKKNDNSEIKKQDVQNLRENFSLLFNNEINDELQDKVFVAQNLENEELGKYKTNIKIPMLNIKNNTARKINSEIATVFSKKILPLIKQNTDEYTIYNVSFFTCLNDNILSIAIKCTLKEGKTAQRLIIKTYNYDIQDDKLLNLEDIIEKKGVDRNNIQKEIYYEIQKQIEKSEIIAGEGYKVYTRTQNDIIYKVENTEEFMLDEKGNLYIIYAYGNNNITGEMDLIVIANSE